MNEFMANVQQLLDYLEANANKLSQETQRELAQFLQEAFQFIEMQQQGDVDSLPPTPPKKPKEDENFSAAFPSSNVEGFAYDDKNEKLLVRFFGKWPNWEGPIYSYDGVPPYIFEMIQRGLIPAKTNGENKWGKWWEGKVPSVGASVNNLLKNGPFPYQRLT